MLISIIRAVLKPEGLTKKEALLADIGWMTVAGVMFFAMLIVH